MSDFLDILKYVLPSLVVLATAYLLIRQLLESEHNRKVQEHRQQNFAVVTPIRLQAYERIVLFLERISPTQLILRVNQQDLDARGLQRNLLNAIREEYEHNLSQQLYLSNRAWEHVKNAKEDMVRIINISESEIPDGASSTELGQRIFENYLKAETQPISAAIEFIKKEIAQIF